MEKGVSHSRWDVAWYRRRSLCSCFASTRLGQILDLYGHSAPHPVSGSRLAKAGSVQLVDRSPIWNGAGHPVFGNNDLRTSLGLFIAESENILRVFVPCVAVGIPLGAYFIRRVDAETFRRICMSFDAWVVGFGLSRVLIELNLMESPWAYSVMATTILIDAYLLYIFFTVQKTVSRQSRR